MQAFFKLHVFLYFAVSSLEKLSPCSVCKKIADNFNNGLLETENNTYEGGTSFGQNKKLSNYKDSELRFITIMEDICKGFTEKNKCLSFIEKYEDNIENWFKKFRKENVNFRSYICVGISKVCCPKNHFGPDCLQCIGLINGKMCSDHGFCEGDGTKSGSGKCSCHPGYGGDFCEKCDDRSFMDSVGFCIPCHISCEGPCVNETAEGCTGNCSQGFSKDDKGICIDIDECEANKTICGITEYCVNTPGSFECKKCHETCLKCNGSGPADCDFCTIGLEKNNENICVDSDECAKNTHDCKGKTYCENTQGSFECLDCHSGCQTGCKGPHLTDCIDCAPGFKQNESGHGCVDIDECKENSNLCKAGEYCNNVPGQYKCMKCDIACDSCHGPGPHSCVKCSKGYRLHKDYCQDETKIQEEEKESSDEL